MSHEFTKIRGAIVHIHIKPDAKPVGQPPRKMPIAFEAVVEDSLDELLSKGIIERVQEYSPWRSPLVPVQKKNKDIRICIDLRAVNKVVLKETHPLPTLELLAARLYGSHWFTKLDVKDAFYQVEIHPDSRGITTFTTHLGLFRYRRLVLGLCSASEIFQRVMESVLAGLEGVYIYIDDILIFGKDVEEHDYRLRMVLARLAEFEVELNLSKCEWRKSEIEFLGHELSARGMAPDVKKVEAILSCPPPASKEELSSFLGLVSYVCSRFLPHMAEICEPLRLLC